MPTFSGLCDIAELKALMLLCLVMSKVGGKDFQFSERSIGHAQGNRGHYKNLMLDQHSGQTEFHQNFFGCTRT